MAETYLSRFYFGHFAVDVSRPVRVSFDNHSLCFAGAASVQPATILTNLTAGQQQQQLLTTVANVVAAGGGEGGDKKGGNLLLTNSQINSAPSRPGILRRRDGDRDGAGEHLLFDTLHRSS